MTSAITTHGLTKDYGSGHGIFDLDLAVEEGEVFGYLGPNGAGKTTTIKLLMGLIHATRGSATVLGRTWFAPPSTRCSARLQQPMARVWSASC